MTEYQNLYEPNSSASTDVMHTKERMVISSWTQVLPVPALLDLTKQKTHTLKHGEALLTLKTTTWSILKYYLQALFIVSDHFELG